MKDYAKKPSVYGRSGRVVCKACRKGYGSEYDGLCTRCRGMTAWEAKHKENANEMSMPFMR